MNATQLFFRSGLAAVFFLLLPAAAQTLPAHYRQTNNIPYVTGGQSRQWLDLYHIPGATQPTPVVVWLHGGGWLSGNENLPRALALTNHNVAVAAISYRYTTNQLASGYPANLPHPAQIHDVKSALRWLRANAAQFNLDPARIGIWGYSAGGHLAALAGTTGHTNLFDVGENLGQSSAVQAVADMSGPANLGLATANQQTANFFTLLLGATAASNPATLATVNPMAHVRPGAPPFLLIHGETDPEVAIAHSEQLHNALTNTGLSSLFVRLPGTGHTIPASQDPLTAQWLATNLTAVVTPTAPYTNDLAALSDEFDNSATLANYQRVNTVEGWNADKLESRDINTSRAGRLTMVPRTGGWFNDYIGELTFKPVSGDFVVSTEVIPRNRAGNAAPTGEYSLAGLMMRTPTSHTTGASGWALGQQNYVFLSMGAANNPGTYQFEVKNTVNSASSLNISSAPAAQAELQIARLGGAVITLRRDAGGQWLVHRRYSRADFPAGVQVGVVAYTDWLGIQARFPIAQPGSYHAQNAAVITDQNPGLRAEFEYLRFNRPQIPAQFAGRDFSSAAQVSDAELLSFLGANANTPATNAPVNVAPAFTTHPQSQAVNVGANVTFTAAATGTPTPTFQWQRSGTNLPGATGTTLTINSVQVSDAGNYSVVASSVAGLATSAAATLTVNVPATPPAVSAAPQAQTVNSGASVTFTVTATGTAPLAYQWQRNGTDLAGATAASLTLNNVTPADSGAVFRVVVTNSAGTVTSVGATLTVNALPPALPGGFPNVTQVPGRLLTPLLAPQQGRTAVLAFHNRWLYSVPESPSSQPNSDLQVRRWDLSDLANVREVEQLGVTPQPVMAHGYLFLGRNLVLGPNDNSWSLRAESPGVNVRATTPTMQGVYTRGHLYQPWHISPTYWSYASNEQQGDAVLSYDGQSLAAFNHLGLTGGLIGHPFIIGNLLIFASDQSRTGVATYDISDPRNPVLLDVLKTGGAGGYWPELWGGDGKLYVVFPYREPGNGMRVVDVTDPANLRFVADVPLPGSECMYVQFQDEFAFMGSHKVDMRTLRSVLTFDARGQLPGTTNVDTSQFALPVGNLLVTGGAGPFQGMAVWAHQAGPDLRGPSVSYHIPRASQANYPTSAPISLLIHETLRSETIEFGTNLIVRPLGGQPITARWTLAFNDTLTISPDGGLLPNTTYEIVVVGGGIRDVADNGIEPLAFTFSTGGNVAGNRAPAVDAFTVSAYPAAMNQLLTFTASASDPDGQPLEYRFDFGDGSPRTAWGTSATASYSYGTNGHYPAAVQARDPSGLVATRTLNVTVLSGPAPGLAARSSGPIALHPASRQVWVVNPDNNSVQTLHADTLARGTERSVGADPRSLAFDASGNAWVTCHDADRIDIVSPAGGVQSLPVRYGSAPFGIVTSPDGGTAYVSMFGSGEIVRFNTTTRAVTGTLALGPTPRALALSADGTRLYVTRFLSLKDDAEVWELDTASLTRLRTFNIHKFGGDPHRDTSAEGMGVANYLASAVITRDGTRLLVAANKMNTEKGVARGAELDDDNTVRNLVLFIDLATGAVVRALDVDNSDSASGLALSPLGDYFFAMLQGNNDLALFDALQAESAAGLGGLLARRAVGSAPQGVCVDPVTRRAFVMNLMSRDVSVLELDTFLRTGALTIAATNLTTATTELLPTTVRRGKELFYHAGDRRMSAEGYISCATCHVDGGHDARVWDFTGRGEGLRNTITLQGRAGTGHGNVHWSGNFDEIQDFEHDIRSFFGGTGFLTGAQFAAASTPLGPRKAGLNVDLDALAAYVDSLANASVPRSPHRAADGALTPAAQAGAAVFAAQNCASCHAGSTLTDGRRHNVGTLRATSGGRLGAALTGIDTPTLRGVWSTAPYFHDGAAATLADVFTVAGGALYPAESGTVAGAAGVVNNDQNYFLNFDETAFGHAFVGLGSGGTLTFTNVHGGSGGLGAIEVRYATAYRPAPLAVRVNGTTYSVTLPLPFNEPAFRMVNWLTYRLENIPLQPGANNTLVLEASTTDLVVDHLVVATPEDLALAQPHRRVLALPATDRDNLLAYVRELDGSPVSNGSEAPPAALVEAPPASVGGQPVRSEVVSFAIGFSRPVSGFTGGDLLVTGTAGPQTVVLVELNPGLTYRVDLAGMTQDGTLAIALPAGAVTAADGQPNAAVPPVSVNWARFVDDLAPLSDEFGSAATLANWQRLNTTEGWQADQLRHWSIHTGSANHMRLEPHTTVWFEGYRGPLAFKLVTGDFIATVRLDVRRANGQPGRPQNQFSLGGLMLRAPRSVTNAAPNPAAPPQTRLPWPPSGYATDWTPGGEDWIAFFFGQTTPTENPAPNQWAYTVSTTDNSVSDTYYSATGIPPDTGLATLQIARVGQTFLLLRQHGSGPWIVEQRLERPDLPATLQVGLTAVGDTENIFGRGLYSPGDIAAAYHYNRSALSAANGFVSTPDVTVDADYFRLVRPPETLTPALLRGLPVTAGSIAVRGLDTSGLSHLLGDAANRPFGTPAPTAPLITQPPVSALVLAGTNHTFTVTATGTGPLSFQWLRNNAPVPDATSATFTLAGVTRASSGNYAVQVTGPGGVATSPPAALRVLNFPRLHPPQRLGNGAFRLHFNDHDGGALTLDDTANFEVWVSTNLVATNWVRINLPLTVTNGLLTLDDPDAATHPRRFYRVLER